MVSHLKLFLSMTIIALSSSISANDDTNTFINYDQYLKNVVEESREEESNFLNDLWKIIKESGLQIVPSNSNLSIQAIECSIKSISKPNKSKILSIDITGPAEIGNLGVPQGVVTNMWFWYKDLLIKPSIEIKPNDKAVVYIVTDGSSLFEPVALKLK